MVWTSANGPKCPVSPEDRGEIAEPRITRLDTFRIRIKRIDDLLHVNNCEEAHKELHDLAHEFEQIAASVMSRPDRWPAGCHFPDSCARHKACMYVKCRHEGRSIAGEVEIAEAALAHPSQDRGTQ